MNLWQRKQYSRLEEDEPLKLRRRPYWIVFIILLLSFLGAIIFSKFPESFMNQVQNHVCSTSLYDYETTFVMDKTYTDLTPSGDDAWESVVPANGGYFFKEVDGKSHRFGIAMFHQMHCLQTLREKIQILANSSNDDTGPRDGHIGHCFDFLRQTLLCHADNTIEEPVHLNEEGEHVDGWVKHQCRSTAPLYELASDTYSTEKKKPGMMVL